MQKSDAVISIFKDCLDKIRINSLLITDHYNINPRIYFKDNRHDQSILSIARKIHGSIILSDETWDNNIGSEYIKKKHCIALMIDQRVSEGEKVIFFGKPALTTTLPAQLSIKFDLEVIPVFIERDKDNKFKIEFQKAINPKNFKNKLELSRELNVVLEKMITRNPGQWIWTHNRWK